MFFDPLPKLCLEWRAGLSDTILKGTHPGTIPARFGLIWFSGFREEDYQDGRQAKNRKRGDEILIVHCCFSVSQNELKFWPKLVDIVETCTALVNRRRTIFD
jgi:hypothetical protein